MMDGLRVKILKMKVLEYIENERKNNWQIIIEPKPAKTWIRGTNYIAQYLIH